MAVAALAPDLAYGVSGPAGPMPPALAAFMARIKVRAEEGLLPPATRGPGRRMSRSRRRPARTHRHARAGRSGAAVRRGRLGGEIHPRHRRGARPRPRRSGVRRGAHRTRAAGGVHSRNWENWPARKLLEPVAGQHGAAAIADLVAILVEADQHVAARSARHRGKAESRPACRRLWRSADADGLLFGAGHGRRGGQGGKQQKQDARSGIERPPWTGRHDEWKFQRGVNAGVGPRFHEDALKNRISATSAALASADAARWTLRS